MEKQIGDVTRAELERRASVAQSEAVSAEHYGYIIAGLFAVVGGFFLSWFLSIPLAIGLYLITVKPKHKAMEKADAELSAYEAANPPTTYF